jgi:hypothetical protein
MMTALSYVVETGCRGQVGADLDPVEDAMRLRKDGVVAITDRRNEGMCRKSVVETERRDVGKGLSGVGENERGAEG